MRLLCLLFLCRLAGADLRWVSRSADGSTPPDAVALEGELLLCRARLADGNLHPGIASGGTCRIPQKGGVETTDTFEVATGGGARWVAKDWQRATPAVRQGRSDLYVCRAEIRVGSTIAGWVYGKAYREGPHAGRCYVAFQNREIEVPQVFELFSLGKVRP